MAGRALPFLVFFAMSLVGPSAAAGQAGTAGREIQQMLTRADIQRALRAIEDLEPSTRADHILLTEIPAPPFMEEQRAAKYAELLQEAGADSVWVDPVGNVLALRRGRTGGRTVALDGHLDTVFPEGTDVTVRIHGDTMSAPGIGDDTRGLVVVLAVLRAMNEAQIETEADVLFIGTVGEEGLGDLRGVKELFGPNGPGIDSWIAVDGVSIRGVTHRGLGSHRYKVTYRGPGGHSWGHFGLGNPHHALGRAIQLFVEGADPYTSEGPRTSYNVGRIGGGTSVNSVPYESWMEVDMRSVSPERLNGVDALLQNAIRQALAGANELRRRGDSLTVDVELIGDRPSGEIDVSMPLVERALAATRHFGVEPRLGIGSTDSNIPISLGIPAVTIGGGGVSDGAHSLTEWFVNEQGDVGIKRALLILAAEAGLTELVN
jgi:acetylornithine deacetylase/succinyl-diaminopimelate desuccinylase-like protein